MLPASSRVPHVPRVPRVVLVGAGHCHAEIIRNANAFTSRGYSLTVISPDEEHVYSGMAPGILGGSWTGAEASLEVAALARRAGVEFIRDRVTGMDPVGKLLFRGKHPAQPYDILSINLGSETVVPSFGGENAWPCKPVRSLVDAARALGETLGAPGSRTVEVAVIGGGFGGIELAANAAAFLGIRGGVTLYTWRLAPSLASHPRRARYVRRALDRRGVKVREGVRVDPGEVEADVIVVATGIKPPAVLRDFGFALGRDGALPVDRFLRVIGQEDVFAVGDCADFTPQPLKRVGVFAVRQQPVLLHNLLVRAAVHSGDASRSTHRQMLPFTDTGRYLEGVNLGPGMGMLYRGRWTLRGAPAWHLKSLIDRRFVRRYRTGDDV